MRENRPRVKKHFSEEKSKTSKLIKKVIHKNKAEKVKLFVLNEDSFSQFSRNNCNKFKKIKKQTIFLMPLDKEKIKTSVKALLEFQQKKNEDKIKNQEKYNKNEMIFIEIKLTQVPLNCQIRPIQIPIPHPIFSKDFKSRICLIVKNQDSIKDMQKKTEEQIISNEIKEKPIISQYICLDDFKNKYKELDQKKRLCKYHDLFLCDFRVYGQLTKIIGSVFLEKKKQVNQKINYQTKILEIFYQINTNIKLLYENIRFPFPVDCEGVPQQLQEKYKNNQEYLKDQVNYSYFQLGKGPVYTFKVARISQQFKQICQNIMHGVYNSIPHLLSDNRKHTQLISVSIKTQDSISIPIFINQNIQQ